MLWGRHRELPVALDRAVRLPGDDDSRMEEEDHRIKERLNREVGIEEEEEEEYEKEKQEEESKKERVMKKDWTFLRKAHWSSTWYIWWIYEAMLLISFYAD